MLLLLLSCALPRPDTLWLYSDAQTPLVRGACEGACLDLAIEAADCPHPAPVIPNLVVSGHSSPPEYLEGSASRIASVVQCYRPELIVLDTCYGASDELLSALGAVSPGVLVVGATYKLPLDGLLYDSAFYDDALPAELRALAVSTRSGRPLSRLRVSPTQLNDTITSIKALPVNQLSTRLVRLHPNFVEATLPSGETILVRLDPAAFQ